MSEMIERVARALYESPGSDMIAKTGTAFPKRPWKDANPSIKDDCRVHARAAIEAMREPTEAMLALHQEMDGNELCDNAGAETLQIVYAKMIDAALQT